ncbi:hypothetical protein DSLASN_32090 [Desulfoluna limicola]|uniref:DUF190 domain-containing protein n=1 Tax=Desulfoluna limicola TaxID=2810562 RepID=A0ABM7PJ51_9BACT|nr:DUF190 domain-containing protein [Desulfoluna limicola]BCS97577.1 hypothetical protein DSLASN_32090 [Desulfoluna limicola]
MDGYFVTFFTQQNRTYRDMPIAKWIIEEATQLGVRGATLMSGREGFGHDGRFHSENYFDQEDPPLQVSMALTCDECDRLMDRLKENQLRVFYTKPKIEFGFTSEG